MLGISSSSPSSEATDNRSQADGFQTVAAGGNKGALSYYNPDAPVFDMGGGSSDVWKTVLLILVAVYFALKLPGVRRLVSKFKG